MFGTDFTLSPICFHCNCIQFPTSLVKVRVRVGVRHISVTVREGRMGMLVDGGVLKSIVNDSMVLTACVCVRPTSNVYLGLF